MRSYMHVCIRLQGGLAWVSGGEMVPHNQTAAERPDPKRTDWISSAPPPLLAPLTLVSRHSRRNMRKGGKGKQEGGGVKRGS